MKKIERKSAELKDFISLRGVRVNNLKNIDVKIPHDQFVVITGVSGSGKSSLAFDTLYAEGQRRYVESLSTYARQFLGRLRKPECDFIEGISPAIAIEQKVSSRNPRSTVGTSTEIYDYLRMLYARIGRTFSPVSGKEVKKNTTDDMIQYMLEHEEGLRMMVLTPLMVRNGRTLAEQLDVNYKSGYMRVELNGELVKIADIQNESSALKPEDMMLVIDRLKVANEKATINRLVDSANTALYEGDGRCVLKFENGDAQEFSLRFEADGIEFEEPTDQMFSFNSPVGACPECEGYGRIIGIDESLVIPDPELSVMDGCVAPWKGEKMSEWKMEFVRRADKYDHFPVFTPYAELTQAQKDMLWHGTYEENEWGNHSICIDEFFRMLRENQYKIQYRVMLARYRGKAICPTCHGHRLKKEAEYVKIGGKSISDLCEMPIDQLSEFFRTLRITEHEAQVSKRLLVEIKSRLQFLVDVGLCYLTLSRLSNTLSGGESQRINLATSLGSSLVGSMYILDEPSIGLHSRDTQRLIKVLRQLQKLGNTVIVVEHDEEIMRAADYIIDIGPDAGRLGGEIVYAGPSHPSAKDTKSVKSHTLDYLSGAETIAIPESRRPWNNYITIKNARANNLKGIDVKFPLNVITCVTGVSGSGKSTLVRDILFLAVKRHLKESADKPGLFSKLEGDLDQIKHVDFVNQNPIGTSSRSNPVTYIGAWDEIRKLIADQQLAKQMGYTPAYFSFNTEGGRCEECKGDGTVTVEMQFMNDLVLECEACHGKRFKSDILDVKYQGVNAYDVLNMTINQAVEFFTKHKQKKIVDKMKPLQDVGLGYIKLGQTSSTLSGGENQRIKLAYYLSQERTTPTLFIFDEPTTGLHFHDIRKLLDAFNALISRGHTIIIIEHNMDVIKCADHVIDLGPEGGEAGGHLVVTGTPEEVARCAYSYTGQFLQDKLR